MVIVTATAVVVGTASYFKRKDDSADDRRKKHQAQIEAIDARRRKDKAYWISWHQRRPNASIHIDPSPRPIRLLSLDGGGVRGIISLVILDRIMRDVAPNAKPCEWFDLIGGTSTGGLIAIMLGRLRMSIPECISAYIELAKEVFDVNILVKVANFLDGYQFSGDKLKEVVERVVERYRGTTSTKMWDNPARRSPNDIVCRTFVVAIPGCNVQRPAKLFRTYNNRFQRQSADQCQIWEAARATSCAPSFFPEVQVDNVYYADGGLGNNNPTKLLLQEAQSLWGPQQRIGCLLSLGTGSVDSFMRQFDNPLDLVGLIGVFKNMALSCDQVHQDMMNNELVRPFYYRFNPEMTKSIRLDEWKKMNELKGIAFDYLAANGSKVTRFARAMRAP